MPGSLSAEIDEVNDAFTSSVKQEILDSLPAMSTDTLEWLVMEHYQFSFANKDLLQNAVECTKKLAEPGVSAELQRNVNEEDGHAPMYKQGMLNIGTDMGQRVQFPATTKFLQDVESLTEPDPSRALGALYATETAAIFEHETFFEICREICERRGHVYQGSLIKRFHDIHLEDGVEQGHKDGLAAFVDLDQTGTPVIGGEPIERAHVRAGALEAIEVMQVWWDALLGQARTAQSGVTA